MTRWMTGFVLAIASMASLSACSNSEAIAPAERLPQGRLARLFCQVEALPPPTRLGADAIPENLRDIQAQYVMRRGPMAMIHLAGAVDDKVSLRLSGVGSTGTRSIELLPGEREAARVLWKAGAADICAK